MRTLAVHLEMYVLNINSSSMNSLINERQLLDTSPMNKKLNEAILDIYQQINIIFQWRGTVYRINLEDNTSMIMIFDVLNNFMEIT